MSRQQDLEDALKNMTDLTVSPGIDITTYNINKSNVEGYYHLLKAMGLATDLNSSSSIENVLKVWVDNKPIIQECKSISFEGKSITKLPYDALNEMRSLVELNISHNTELTIDPEKFKTFQKRLISIRFSSCRMSPATFDAISNCERLEKLDLIDTSLKGILDSDNYSWGNLKKTLIELNLSCTGSTIEALHRVAELESLRVLNASLNDIDDLSNWLCWQNLSNLTKLDLSYNQLTNIPDSIGDLSNLIWLNLSANRLTSIPESIGNLSNLTELDLYDNKLTSIPDSIGSLSNLLHLNLTYNMLTSVPSTIRNLRNTLNGIDISSNDGIVLYGDSETNFGLEQLVEIFGRRLRYTMPMAVIIDEVHSQLKKASVYWNFDRLKKLRIASIPHIDMTMDEMMGIWMSLPKEGIDEGNASAMTKFIQHIYKSDERCRRVLPLAREFLQLSKNLLGSVLNILSTKSETNKELVESHINNICEGLKHCNDRKLSELRLAYYTLIDKLDNQDETLDSLIDNIISSEKEKVFDFTFIRNTNKNVHVQRYWKYRLRDEVGFDFDVNTKFGTQALYPLYGHPGNALAAFYSNFTPEHAIEVLTIRINEAENHTHMSELMKTIFNDNELTTEEKESMLVGDIESSMFTGITRKGVKYYLLKQGLIAQNQRQQSVWSYIKHIFTLFIDKIFCCLS